MTIPRTPEGLALVPSVLLTEALADLEKVEQSDEYVIHMGKWHEPTLDSDGDPVCAVCFAGAVMAGTLATPAGDNITPGCFEKPEMRLLHALDYVRWFNWMNFIHKVNHARDACGLEPLDFSVGLLGVLPGKAGDEYEISPTLFKDTIHTAIIMLKAHKL